MKLVIRSKDIFGWRRLLFTRWVLEYSEFSVEQFSWCWLLTSIRRNSLLNAFILAEVRCSGIYYRQVTICAQVVSWREITFSGKAEGFETPDDDTSFFGSSSRYAALFFRGMTGVVGTGGGVTALAYKGPPGRLRFWSSILSIIYASW